MKPTSIEVTRNQAGDADIHVYMNSSVSTITVPASAVAPLAALLAGGKPDTLLSPDWTTAAERQAAREAEAAKNVKAA